MKQFTILLAVVLTTIAVTGCNANTKEVQDSPVTQENITTGDVSSTGESELPDKTIIRYGRADDYAINVSIINLIANPDKYDGKVVRVQGIGNIEFEGNALYLSTEDYEVMNGMNAIGLVPDYGQLNATEADLTALNGQPVLIEGVFEKNTEEYEYFFSGTINNVHRYEAAMTRDEVKSILSQNYN